MRAVTDGRLPLTHEVRRHLELCLDCRACETACPSGVQYGKLIEPFRVQMEQADDVDRKTDDWFHRWILFRLFPYPSRLRKALWPARVAQRLKLDRLAERLGLLRLLPPRLRQLVAMLPPPRRRERPLPEVMPAEGRRRARVALFTGCVGDVMFRHTHWATIRVLQKNGCDVVVPRGQVCCGAIHFHSGNEPPAHALAEANLAAFDASELDAIIVNVAGCGAMLKDYSHHWPDDEHVGRNFIPSVNVRQNLASSDTTVAGEGRNDIPSYERFSAKVKDVSEFLDELGFIPPEHPLRIKATYHDACHLAHAQRVREAPRNLLAQVPGLQLVNLPESDLCCGAAGTYNLTEPEMAGRLSRRKLQNILSTGADVVITGNAGCLLQIAREARQQGRPLQVVHPMDVLDASYQGKASVE
jgi:glycolate oxidase iron-sulfur subunit